VEVESRRIAARVGEDAARAAARSFAFSALVGLGAALLLASVVLALLPYGPALATLVAGALATAAGLGGLWALRRRRRR
jgi:hypothetical protein